VSESHACAWTTPSRPWDSLVGPWSCHPASRTISLVPACSRGGCQKELAPEAANEPGSGSSPRLLGRTSECEALDRLLTDGSPAGVASSSCAARRRRQELVIELCTDQAAGWHVATAVGVESEMELAYSGLHQLCGPMLDHLDRLPVPQREALAVVFGQSTGPTPDRFLVGLRR
jgi:hypothetical protein